MSKILISGYYGFNNVGDEAILKGIIEGIKKLKENAEIVVLSHSPDFTARKHDVRSIKRMNFFKIFWEMKNMDLLVSGGGSLFQDVTSKRSIAYYLGIIWMAKRLLKKKVMVYSQGIGPVTKGYNRFLLKKIMNCVDIINVRDEKSKDELISMGIKKEILVTTDTVFGIPAPSTSKGLERLEKMGVDNNGLKIGISIRPWKNSDYIIKETTNFCEKYLEENDGQIILIPFHFYSDLKIMEKVYEKIDLNLRDRVFVVRDYLYVEDYLSFVGNMDMMVAMRLHGLIFSVLMKVPVIGLSYDPKIDSFMSDIGRTKINSVEDFKGLELADEVKKMLEMLDVERKNVLEKLEMFKSKADTHNEILIDLLKK